MARSALERAGLIARSGMVWGASFATMGGVFGAAAALAPVLPFRRTHRFIGAPGMALCLRYTGSEVEVLRHPGFDPGRPSVFCQNHVSLFDAHAACAAIPGPFCGLMNWWHFHVPFYGWLMRLSEGIPVPPRRPGRYAEVARAARGRAAKGLSILTFPEGHRTLDGRVGPFRSGAFRMARDAGLPVVPLASRGLFELMPKGTPLVRPSRVRLLVGPQLETAGLDDEGLAGLAAAVASVVSAFAERGEADERLVDERLRPWRGTGASSCRRTRP